MIDQSHVTDESVFQAMQNHFGSCGVLAGELKLLPDMSWWNQPTTVYARGSYSEGLSKNFKWKALPGGTVGKGISSVPLRFGGKRCRFLLQRAIGCFRHVGALLESLMGTRLCTHRWKLKPLEKRARETKISWILKTKQNLCQLVMLKSQKWQIVLHMAALPIWGSSKCQWSLLSAPDESWQMRFPNWSVISICCTPH